MKNKLIVLLCLIIASCAHKEVDGPIIVLHEDPVILPTPAPIESVKWKIPPVNAKFQIMDEDDGDYVKQLKPDTKVVNVELFGTDLKRNQALKAKGVYLVCYYSLSKEKDRPDTDQYPKDAVGAKMSGWDELWPILEKESLHLFMDKRDQLAKDIGCDAVEIDNMDNNNKGAKSVVMNSLIRRAKSAHEKGLGLIAKNTGEYSKEISIYSDGVFVEECRAKKECDNYLPWQGKFAGFVEYSKSDAKCLPWGQVQYHAHGYFTADYGACK